MTPNLLRPLLCADLSFLMELFISSEKLHVTLGWSSLTLDNPVSLSLHWYFSRPEPKTAPPVVSVTTWMVAASSSGPQEATTPPSAGSAPGPRIPGAGSPPPPPD